MKKKKKAEKKLWRIKSKGMLKILMIFFPIRSLKVSLILKLYTKGYPENMRLQRRFYKTCTVCFIIFIIPSNCKLVCF